MGKTKTICLRSLILSLLWISVVSTDATVINGINYSLDSDKGEAAVISNSPKYSGKIVIPKEVTRNGYLYRVTSIGERAFKSCFDLTSVTIPNSVTSIGSFAFDGCFRLTSITIGNSVTSIGSFAFDGCSGLTSITIPNSVTSIGEGAFYGCSGLTSVTIPNSVTSIGSEAFSKCFGLTSITIGNSVTSINSYAFDGCSGLTSVTIGNSVTSIGSFAFDGCSGLTSVTIPNRVTYIGSSAFSGCSGLTSVTAKIETPLPIPNYVFTNRANATLYVPAGSYLKYKAADYWKEFKEIVELASPSGMFIFENNTDGTTCSVTGYTEMCTGHVSIPSAANGRAVTSIGESAFSNCTGLTSIYIPNSVTSIGSGAFYGCSGLTSITIPNSVTSIGSGAFSACYGLTSLKVEASNTKYDSRDNCNAIIETATNRLIRGTKNTIIPNSVKSIGSSAFYGCFGLTSVTIPNSVTSIGSSAFYGCFGLTSVTIPNSVTSIGEYNQEIKGETNVEIISVIA